MCTLPQPGARLIVAFGLNPSGVVRHFPSVVGTLLASRTAVIVEGLAVADGGKPLPVPSSPGDRGSWLAAWGCLRQCPPLTRVGVEAGVALGWETCEGTVRCGSCR